ncbi:MAG: TM2 domain-containing protein [Flavobacteriales bacterium]
MKSFVFISVFMLMCSALMQAQSNRLNDVGRKILLHKAEDGGYELRNCFTLFSKEQNENPRLVAIALDATLGMLGVHRLYLGTDLKVPILYTITAGGGCVLWLVDLGLLIFSKDIEKYYNNPRIFMWTVD